VAVLHRARARVQINELDDQQLANRALSNRSGHRPTARTA
jgi:hypothetical protein